MTPEVKKRIEQIRRGIVPEGYKKSKIGIVPVEWQDTEFSSLFTSTSDFTSDIGKYPLLKNPEELLRSKPKNVRCFNDLLEVRDYLKNKL